MLPIRNFFIDSYVMDMVLDGSSDEDPGSFSDHSVNVSDGSEGTIDNQEDDPDYDPEGGDIPDDTEEGDIPDDTERGDIPDDAEGGAMDDTQENSTPEPSPDQSFPARDQNNQPSGAAVANCGANAEPESKPGGSDIKPIACTQRGSEDDAQCCTICFEPWTNSSEHRLVSLRCGHLFGRSCITRWLKGQNTRCPQCNSRARRSEIRNIYARAVKVLDSTERDKALRELARECELRRATEMTVAQERMRHMMAVEENERLKRELIEAQRQLTEFRSGLKACNAHSAISMPVFSLVQTIELAKTGGCRILDSSSALGMILASQPSANHLFQGFGFRKISTIDMKASEFMLVHQKPIRDLVFHPRDGLVLSASQDKTIKITNIISNAVVQTHNLGSDAWSCAWDSDNPNFFYGGLKTGEVLMYDIRMTSRHINELPKYGAKTPVASLQYLQQPESPSYKLAAGPLVGKLTDCSFYQKNSTNSDGYKVIPLPTPGPVICLSSISTGHCLVSCRPSAKHPNVTHTLCDFVTTPSNELVCVPLKTLLGGRSQSQLTRTKLLTHPDKESSSLVCVGDEDARGILVWDGSSGDCLINMKTGGSVLDLSGLKMNCKSYLTALLDKSLLVFSWNNGVH